MFSVNNKNNRLKLEPMKASGNNTTQKMIRKKSSIDAEGSQATNRHKRAADNQPPFATSLALETSADGRVLTS